MPRTLLLGALMITAAMPASAQVRRDRDEESPSRIDTTFAFDRRGTVTLALGSGDIIVRTWNRDQVQVRARSQRGVLRMDASSTRLSLDLVRQRGGETRMEVTVPAGVRVSARAMSGDISINGAKGGVQVNTQSGDIELIDVGDMIEVGTLSGDISGRGLAGSVKVGTTSGDVTLSDVRGDVEMSAVSGDIEIRNVVARYVRARSTSGDISYDGAIDATGRYELTSHSGGVALSIPQNAGALVTVSTYSGTIESDFPITLKPGEHGIGTSKRFTFEIGKGDARINAQSFSGDIVISSKGSRPSNR